MKICLTCGDKFPSKELVEGKWRVYSSRKHCLKCSPYGEHKIGGRVTISETPGFCVVCSKPLKELHRRCDSCTVQIHRIRQKLKAVSFLGGQCNRCKWKPENAIEIVAFDFHHKKGKDFQLSSNMNRPWKTIEPELKKCELLCARCHRIQHTNRSENLLKELCQSYTNSQAKEQWLVP